MPREVPIEQRLWRKVDRSGDCWIWRGATTWSTPVYARGNMQFRGKTDRPHRVSWIIAFGEIPEGMCVLHRCDNGLCVKPDHLFLGTHKENTADMIAKGRRSDTTMPGELNRFAKLTEEQAREILSRANAGERFISIARDYPVCTSTVQSIVRGNKWKHLQERS